jgi:hypothetical protein
VSDDLLDIQYLLDRPIAYHRAFVDVTGSVSSAVFLSQAVYWQRRVPHGRDGWYYKSIPEWGEETGLTRNHIQSARTALERLGVMEFQLRGFPRRTWYRLNVERLRDILLRCREKSINSASNPTDRQLDSTYNQLDSAHSRLDAAHSQLDSTHSQLDSTHSQLDSTHSQLDSTDQSARNQPTDLTEITNNKTKKYNFSDFVPVDNFQPTEDDRSHFENLPLQEPFDLVVMEFRLYHRDLNTPAMNSMAWSKLLRGWCDVRVHGLPEHPATTGRNFGGNHE